MIFSAVRSNRLGRLGFLQDERRANVVLTRARRGLVVLADVIAATVRTRRAPPAAAALPPMLAYATAATVLTLRAPPPVLADTTAPAVFA